MGKMKGLITELEEQNNPIKEPSDEELQERECYFGKIDYTKIIGGNSVELSPERFNEIIGENLLPTDVETQTTQSLLEFHSQSNQLVRC